MNGQRLTVVKAVAALDAIDIPSDPEQAHADADEILRRMVDPRVNAAYQACVQRTGRWWFA